MPVQRIVMPDGTTRAFRENARPAEIDAARAERLERMQQDGSRARLTQFAKADEDYVSPDPSSHPDVVATDEQRRLAIAQAQTLPDNTLGYEWSSSYRDGRFSKWDTLHDRSRSTIDGGADFSLHYHPGAPRDPRVTRKNFFPGPGDPAAVFQTGKPAFLITPDRNTLVEYGIERGRYYARPVWQRPGTGNARDYAAWQPANLAKPR